MKYLMKLNFFTESKKYIKRYEEDTFKVTNYWKIRTFSIDFLIRVFEEIGFPTDNYWYDFAMNLVNGDSEYILLLQDIIFENYNKIEKWRVYFEFEKERLLDEFPDSNFEGVIEPTEIEINMKKYNL